MKKKKKTPREWAWQFSKVLTMLLTILYITERIYAMVIIILHGEETLETFLTTGTEVFLAAVVAYALKSGFENVFKIKKVREKEDETEE